MEIGCQELIVCASEDLNNMLDAALALHLIQRFLGTIHPALDLSDVLLECFHLTLVILHDRWKAVYVCAILKSDSSVIKG